MKEGVEIGKKKNNRKRRVHIAHIGIGKSGRDLGSKASHIGKNAPAREPAAGGSAKVTRTGTRGQASAAGAN